MFNPDDYEPVATRLDRWLKIYLVASSDVFPRVITHLHEYGSDYCVFRAELWLDDMLIATGWAEERRTERGITFASMVEVCETSAIGRALANAGIAGSDPSKRASREEMQKAVRYETTQSSSTGQTRPASEKQIGAIIAMSKKAGRTPPPGYQDYTAAQASEAIQALNDLLDAK